MQNCFRQYPEVYGSELESDAADDEDDLIADAAMPTPDSTPSSRATTSAETPSRSAPSKPSPESDKQKQPIERSSTLNSPEKVTEHRPELGLVPGNYKPDAKSDTGRANQASSQVKNQEPVSESEDLVPKAAHDAGDENTKVPGRK